MPTATAKTLGRFRRQLVTDTKQVFEGNVGQPVGPERVLVTLGNCGQLVEAAGGGHLKGAAVFAVRAGIGAGASYGVLNAPPSKPGPQVAGTFKVGGAAYAAPVPQRVVGLLFTLDTSPATIYAFEYDQATGDPIALLASVPAIVGSDDFSGMTATGLGASNFIVAHGREFAFGFARDYLMLVNVQTATKTTYLWPIPPSPNGSKYKISNPAIKDGDIYWVELEFDNLANEHTWELMRAPSGNLAAAVIDTTLTLANTTLDPGTVEDIHIRSDHLPFFDSATSTWLYDTEVRWWDGGQFSTQLGLTIEFGPTTQEIPLVSRAAPTHVVDGGNVGVGASLAVEYNAAGVPSLIWPDSGDTATPLSRVVSGIGHDLGLGSYVVTTRPSFAVNGLFDWREGDLTDPTPTITLVDCSDASALVGGVALEPLAGMRA